MSGAVESAPKKKRLFFLADDHLIHNNMVTTKPQVLENGVTIIIAEDGLKKYLQPIYEDTGIQIVEEETVSANISFIVYGLLWDLDGTLANQRITFSQWMDVYNRKHGRDAALDYNGAVMEIETLASYFFKNKNGALEDQYQTLKSHLHDLFKNLEEDPTALRCRLNYELHPLLTTVERLRDMVTVLEVLPRFRDIDDTVLFIFGERHWNGLSETISGTPVLERL